MGSAREEVTEVGVVEHYFPAPHVAAIRVERGAIEWGDRIFIRGHGAELSEPIESMEIEHEHVTEAHRGDHVGVRIMYPVHAGDRVFVQHRHMLAPPELRSRPVLIEM